MDKKRPEVLGYGWRGVSLCSLNLLKVGLLFLLLVLDPYRWDQPSNEQLGMLAKPLFGWEHPAEVTVTCCKHPRGQGLQ